MIYEGRARWDIKKPDNAVVQGIIAATGLPFATASAMANRGVTPGDALAYVGPASVSLPDPFSLLNMDKAAKRFADAVQGNERVTIWNDYDSDGLAAGSCLSWFCRFLGVPSRNYTPDRFTMGYGLNCEGIKQLAAEGETFIVSVDCGVHSLAEAELCKSLCVSLVICDHHQPGALIPDAMAVVNPLLPGDQFPYKKIAGVGVAYFLVLATTAILRDRGWFNNNRPEPVVETLLPLVALGTVADVVELQSVNRALVAQGIHRIREGMHPFEGIRALCEVSAVNETTLSSGQISWRLAPMVNCSGRLSTAQISLDLLNSESYAEALPLARKLDDLNTERREIEAGILEEAIAMVEKKYTIEHQKSIVLAAPGWSIGVIGIVASRITERYNRPTVIISIDGDTAKGSGRSIKPFNLYEGLCSCSDHLVKFGGHPMAAGLTMSSNQIDAFESAFEKAASHLTDDDLRPVITLDAEVVPSDMSLQACDEMGRLEPFGMGNSRPLFCLTRCKVEDVKVLKGKHLKLVVSKEGKKFNAIGFNMATVPLKDIIDIAFSPEKNEWMGRTSLQLQIKGLR